MRTPLFLVASLLVLAGCKKEQPAAGAPDAAAATAQTPAGTFGGTAGGQAPSPAEQEQPGPWMQKALGGQDLYATLKTNQGTVVVKLFSKDAPRTVANFVGLAAGEKSWTDPRSGEKTKRPLYDGTVFHRVIPDFMIQGGDPMGTGMGDPGYRFEDELGSGRGFDKAGILAMANRGPGTNGSQFFITVAPTPWLNNRHTIFGEVVKGYDVVEKISKVKTEARSRPAQDVVVQAVTVSDKAPAGGGK